VAKWTELFNEIMLPTAHKLGIKKIKESKLFAPTYARVMTRLRAYFQQIYSYSRANPEEAKKAVTLFNSYVTMAFNRYRAALNRKRV